MRNLPFLAILATLGFVCAAILGFAPATPRGVQCPTAPVQTITVRDCCGRVVVRAPHPGERSFVQCACAEKKAETVKATVGSKVDLILPPATLTIAYAAAPSLYTIPRYEASFLSTSLAPPTPPPA